MLSSGDIISREKARAALTLHASGPWTESPRDNLVKLARDTVSWSENSLYCLDPVLDPLRGGNPDVVYMPYARAIVVPGWWSAIYPDEKRLAHVIVVAASMERFDAICAVASRDPQADMMLRALDLAPNDEAVWRGFDPSTWCTSGRGALPTRGASAKRASRLSRGYWAIYEAALILERDGTAKTRAEAVAHILRTLGGDEDLLAGDTMKKAPYPARWKDTSKLPHALMQGTNTALAIRDAIVAKTSNAKHQES